jgi:hypothetical protein
VFAVSLPYLVHDIQSSTGVLCIVCCVRACVRTSMCAIAFHSTSTPSSSCRFFSLVSFLACLFSRLFVFLFVVVEQRRNEFNARE